MALDQYDKEIQEIQAKKFLEAEKMMESDNPADIIKAQNFINKEIKKKEGESKSYLFAPDGGYDSGMPFKKPRSRVSLELLSNVRRVPQVFSIINTRMDQVQKFINFTTDNQKEGFTIKVKSSLFEEAKKSDKYTDQEKKDIEYIYNFLEYGGEKGKWQQTDDLVSFIRKILFDSLSMDQAAFEVGRNKGGDPVEVFAVDASTIRVLQTVDPAEAEKYRAEEINGILPSYCQVFQGNIVKDQKGNQVLYYPWELAFLVRNEETSIYSNGYGTSEIEVAMNIITWMLWSMEYNGNFFKQGSAPRGFFTHKGSGNQRTIDNFKQQWRSQMTGVSASHKIPFFEGADLEWVDMMQCLHGDSEVVLPKGRKTLHDVLEGKDEIYTKIWDGKKFSKARVFRTGEKQIMELTLHNRTKIKTSPDHKFLVLRNGNPTWVERRDITLDDYVFVNKKTISCDNMKNFAYKNNDLGNDLFEILGWITGDGNIGHDQNSKRMIKLYYHPIKELDILDNHLKTFKKYGINAKKYIVRFTEERIKERIEKENINSMIGEYPYIAVVDSDFYRFVMNIGMNPSQKGKVIPDILYSCDSDKRCSFLRGFFSADGHIRKNGGRVDITISNKNLMEQTRMLLMSEGIRCSSFKLKKSIGKISNKPFEDNVLLLKDRDIYFEKIGFLQKYKQERIPTRQKSLYKINEAPKSYIMDFALAVKEYNKTLDKKDKLNKKDLHDLLNISKAHQKASLSKVIHYANKIGYKIPDFLIDYNLEQVIELNDTDEFVNMVDVEMFNKEHQFIANGMVVHNSNRDMEFQSWNELLLLVLCSVYKIDPSELGFNLSGQAQMFGQDGQKQRLDHSKKKGLQPLLSFLEKAINKHIVSELKGGKYEFKFTGIDLEDEGTILENDVKKIQNGMVSMEDMFEKYSERKFDEKKDTILNSVYLQQQQMNQFGGEESNEAVADEFGGEDEGVQNPFEMGDEAMSKSMSSNPILMETMKYAQDIFSK